MVIFYKLWHLLCNHLIYKFVTFSLPWDQDTLVGYTIEQLFVIFTGSSYLFCNGSLLVLFISIVWFHEAFYAIFQNTLRELDQPNRSRSNEEFLRQLIQFHVLTKESVQFIIFFSIYILDLSIHFHSNDTILLGKCHFLAKYVA